MLKEPFAVMLANLFYLELHRQICPKMYKTLLGYGRILPYISIAHYQYTKFAMHPLEYIFLHIITEQSKNLRLSYFIFRHLQYLFGMSTITSPSALT